jgi:hypothetical protein
MTKSQKEMLMLGALVAAIIGVLGYYLIRSGKEGAPQPYKPRAVNTSLPEGLFKHPEYQRLSAPVKLPLEAGAVGNASPFSGARKEAP